MGNKQELTNEIRQMAIAVAVHTIGLDNKRPFTKDGSKIYCPYRNYFNTWLQETPWPELEAAGYATHGKVRENECGMKTTDYYLTPDGLQWLARELKINICVTY